MESDEIRKTRGRPRAFDRALALDKALRLFWAQGYEGTSMSDLTSALGINAPSLYAAFESKPALYSEALELYLARQHEQITALMDQALSAREALEAMLYAAAEQYTRPDQPAGCPIASGVLRSAEANEAMAQLTATHRRNALAMIAGRIALDIRRGLMSAQTDVDGLAMFYAGVIQGMSVQAIDGASHAQLNALVKIALRAWPAHA
ncbi:TetR/AcrR family transcriptional regulator [Iodobacter fluviatilis]|uniref:Intercellular adhesion protein R n=1 Tax=Iodobacter fluviatilis TaxID=537 RepID=A0A377Q7T1_9NEIS|nr:TetR/AcrR family transcriptional regulator [Iodobacter fluviatilis]TCU89408.1 TetR family transcriptional regulator [Iodobacter fluviatilis]STQ90778.1 Intercellular adhesion protein R [Iodobacter fluviatilis]